MTWQPIETAPKDGQLIRLRQGAWLPCHARWVDDQWCYVEYHRPSRPTHWMPVPGHQNGPESTKDRSV